MVNHANIWPIVTVQMRWEVQFVITDCLQYWSKVISLIQKPAQKLLLKFFCAIVLCVCVRFVAQVQAGWIWVFVHYIFVVLSLVFVQVYLYWNELVMNLYMHVCVLPSLAIVWTRVAWCCIGCLDESIYLSWNMCQCLFREPLMKNFSNWKFTIKSFSIITNIWEVGSLQYVKQYHVQLSR